MPEPLTLFALAALGAAALNARRKAKTEVAPTPSAMRIEPTVDQPQVTEFETEIIEEPEIQITEVEAFSAESTYIEPEIMTNLNHYYTEDEQARRAARFRGMKKGHYKRYEGLPHAINPYVIPGSFDE